MIFINQLDTKILFNLLKFNSYFAFYYFVYAYNNKLISFGLLYKCYIILKFYINI